MGTKVQIAEDKRSKIITIILRSPEARSSIVTAIIDGFPKAYDIERNKLEKDLESNTIYITTLRLKLSTRF